jgi:dihydrofolate synthase/folylpolyglutamate synthase
LHPSEIELGLERIDTVRERLGIPAKLPVKTVVVGGTNGKGSTAAFLDALLRQSGYTTALYTSPHLLNYEERLLFSGTQSDTSEWCKAFERINCVRGEVSLTYFEFGTLAALLQIVEKRPDVAILEIGLGGRLDAVNCIDSDLAILTSIQLDHCDWLGETLEQIGYEKAGIAREGRPIICAEPSPPQSVREQISLKGAELYQYGIDYQVKHEAGDTWTLLQNDPSGEPWRCCHLPLPMMLGNHQLRNAATAWVALNFLYPQKTPDCSVMHYALQTVKVSGRCEILPGPFLVVLDVAHNEDAVRELTLFLAQKKADSTGVLPRVIAVFGMMKRKNLAGTISQIGEGIDLWILPEMGISDMYASDALKYAVLEHNKTANILLAGSYAQGVSLALETAQPGDIVVIFGSFKMVEAWYRLRSNTVI